MNNASLVEEIAMLRSLAVSLVGRDTEGNYRPDFVRKSLRTSGLQPTQHFVDRKSFLAELSKNA